jgi:hypothetical protein
MKLGGDPEIFLIDKNKNFKSVIGLIGANKWDPMQVPGLPKGFTLQEDNVALELGFPPAGDEDEFLFNVRTAMEAGLSKLNSNGRNLRLSRASCTVFPEGEMEQPEAHIFGCEPDFNAWTGQENPKPKPPHKLMRSCGGHVHFGFDDGEDKPDFKLVGRASDLCLAIPSVLLDDGYERKQIYGKAGSIRFKPYGGEYRTLSNFWIFNKSLIRWVYNNALLAVNMVKDGQIEDINMLGDDIQAAINNNDKKQAAQLIKYFDVAMP